MIDRQKIQGFLGNGKTAAEVAARFDLSPRRARQILIEMTNELLTVREWQYPGGLTPHGRYVYRKLASG